MGVSSVLAGFFFSFASSPPLPAPLAPRLSSSASRSPPLLLSSHPLRMLDELLTLFLYLILSSLAFLLFQFTFSLTARFTTR